MGNPLGTVAAIVGLAWGGLRHERLRTLLAVVGVAMAVVAIVLLAGAGVGVLETGERQFERADRDVWITGDAVGLTAAGGGGFEATIHDAHPLADEIADREDVRSASPMGFQTVYVGTDPADLDTVVASGVPGGGDAVSIDEGDGFGGADTHYADGDYDGPKTGELLVDRRTAERYELSVGDRLHVGGSVATARATEYEVVGISETFAAFLGAPTVTLRLSELQTLTGASGTDAATMIAVTVEDDAEVAAVADDLRAAYPEYAVRTDEEQLRAVLGQQAAVLVGAGVLVGLAVLTGLALAITLFVLHVYQRREEYRTLGAIGISRRTVVGVVLAQGAILGVSGWLVGAALAVPSAHLLNALVTLVVGYEGLVVVPPWAVATGGVVAVVVGTLAAAIAVWRLPDATA